MPYLDLEYRFLFADGSFTRISGFDTIFCSDNERYYPVFFGDFSTLCLALYAEDDSIIELSILSGIDANQLSVASEYGASATDGRLDGNSLRLFAGETAVISGLELGMNYTLNGSSRTLNTYTFSTVSGNYTGGNATPPPNSGGTERKLLRIALNNAAGFYNKRELYTDVSWLLFEEFLQTAELVYDKEDASQAEIDAAADALFDAMMSLQGKSPETEAYDTLDFGNAKADFTLSWETQSASEGATVILNIIAAEAAYISAVRFDLEFGEELEFDYAGGQNGFTAVRSVSDGATASVALVRFGGQTAAANRNSFNVIDTDGLGSAVVAKIRFRVKSGGKTGVTLAKSLVAAIDSNGYGADISANTPVSSSELVLTGGGTEGTSSINFNRDKIISMADLSTATSWYRASPSEASVWQDAQAADLDGDGVITVADFVLILFEIEKYE